MKQHILHIQSSPRGKASRSTLLGNKIIEKLLREHPGSTVTINNVVHTNYPPIDLLKADAYLLHEEHYTDAHHDAMSVSDRAIEELFDATIIVISVATYNFNIPAALKGWIDQIVRARKTFSYETGIPEGLLKDRKVYLAIASNAIFSDGPIKPMDHAEPYLRFIFGFLGLTDITTYRIEGLGIPGIKETAVEKGIALAEQ